jgi:hypothetical protein
VTEANHCIVTHIRVDGESTAEYVVTFCGRYNSSSVSEFHMREIECGRIDPFPEASITICAECACLAGI